MTKIIVKALEGFEKIFDELNEMKMNIEADKQTAYEEAMLKIDEEFAEKLDRIDRSLEVVSTTEEIEVPDEEEVVVEETAEVTEENVEG